MCSVPLQPMREMREMRELPALSSVLSQWKQAHSSGGCACRLVMNSPLQCNIGRNTGAFHAWSSQFNTTAPPAVHWSALPRDGLGTSSAGGTCKDAPAVSFGMAATLVVVAVAMAAGSFFLYRRFYGPSA